jgi:methylase of polypeptide subunit release factors
MTDEYQKEVYMLARDILQKMSKHSDKKLTVIDVGCGSGWKLVHYLSDQFRTVGIDTEPAYSFLKKTYPDQVFCKIN